MLDKIVRIVHITDNNVIHSGMPSTMYSFIAFVPTEPILSTLERFRSTDEQQRLHNDAMKALAR